MRFLLKIKAKSLISCSADNVEVVIAAGVSVASYTQVFGWILSLATHLTWKLQYATISHQQHGRTYSFVGKLLSHENLKQEWLLAFQKKRSKHIKG